MTAEIINLRRFKKAKDRAEKQAAAEQNRISFGRTKLEREAAEIETERVKRKLDGRLLLRKTEPEDTP